MTRGRGCPYVVDVAISVGYDFRGVGVDPLVLAKAASWNVCRERRLLTEVAAGAVGAAGAGSGEGRHTNANAADGGDGSASGGANTSSTSSSAGATTAGPVVLEPLCWYAEWQKFPGASGLDNRQGGRRLCRVVHSSVNVGCSFIRCARLED